MFFHLSCKIFYPKEYPRSFSLFVRILLIKKIYINKLLNSVVDVPERLYVLYLPANFTEVMDRRRRNLFSFFYSAQLTFHFRSFHISYILTQLKVFPLVFLNWRRARVFIYNFLIITECRYLAILFLARFFRN